MEATIWYYAFGKPTEHLKVDDTRRVEIIHKVLPAPSADSVTPLSAAALLEGMDLSHDDESRD